MSDISLAVRADAAPAADPFAALTDTAEHERAVLTAAMGSDPVKTRKVVSGLREDMFYHSRNREIFRAIKSLVDDGQDVVDPLAVASRQSELGEGVQPLQIMEANWSAFSLNYEHHMAVLRARYAARMCVAAAQEFVARLCVDATADEAVGQWQTALDEVRSINESCSAPAVTLNDCKRMAREAANSQQFRVPTGIRRLDEVLRGGIKPGELFVVGAAPGVGKSSFAQTILHAAAVAGHRCLNVSLEMSDEEIGARALATEPGLSMDWTDRPDRMLNAEQLKAVDRALEDPYDDLVYVSHASTLTQISAEVARRLGGKEGGVAVIDYLQLAERTPDDPYLEAEFLGKVTRTLKLLAGHEHVAIVLLSQFNRQFANEHREPRLSDLRGSGSIEQDANQVLLLSEFDPESPCDQGAEERCVKFNLAKNRGGRRTEFELLFNAAHMRFQEVSTASMEAYRAAYDKQG